MDTRRSHVAVPYIALNQVEIWQLPREGSDAADVRMSDPHELDAGFEGLRLSP